MNRAAALALVLMATGTALAFAAPVAVAAALALVALAALRRGRLAFLALAGSTVLLNALVLAVVVPGDGLALGPVRLGSEGALLGVAAALRLVAALGANLAVLAWFPPARLLDGLGLPARATALAGAVLVAAHDVGRDFARLRTSLVLRDAWPRGRLARAAAAARLLPPLLVAGVERAEVRRDALRLAGHDVGPRFVPIVAVAALAVAGRLAFLAFPNVALTFVVVFLGGVLFGARVAMAGGALAMLLTDLALTGLHVPALANVPAMALVGLLGGAMRRVDLAGGSAPDRAAARLLAASCGILATAAFSVAADTATWLLLYRDVAGAWTALVVAGVAFNAVPALVNAALFAAAVAPTVRAFRARAASRAPPRAPPRAPTAAARPAAPEPRPRDVLR